MERNQRRTLHVMWCVVIQILSYVESESFLCHSAALLDLSQLMEKFRFPLFVFLDLFLLPQC